VLSSLGNDAFVAKTSPVSQGHSDISQFFECVLSQIMSNAQNVRRLRECSSYALTKTCSSSLPITYCSREAELVNLFVGGGRSDSMIQSLNCHGCTLGENRG